MSSDRLSPSDAADPRQVELWVSATRRRRLDIASRMFDSDRVVRSGAFAQMSAEWEHTLDALLAVAVALGDRLGELVAENTRLRAEEWTEYGPTRSRSADRNAV